MKSFVDNRHAPADGRPEHPDNLPLAIHDLTVAYHRKPVIWDIELNIPEGKLVGVVGPNGAGKTTTFYMLVGLIRSFEGDVLIDKSNISSDPMHIRARKGF